MFTLFTIQHLILGIVQKEVVVLSIYFWIDDCRHPYSMSIITLSVLVEYKATVDWQIRACSTRMNPTDKKPLNPS